MLGLGLINLTISFLKIPEFSEFQRLESNLEFNVCSTQWFLRKETLEKVVIHIKNESIVNILVTCEKVFQVLTMTFLKYTAFYSAFFRNKEKADREISKVLKITQRYSHANYINYIITNDRFNTNNQRWIFRIHSCSSF